MKTPVFVKMDAPELLLLSEGVCRQVGMICYHPDVRARNGKIKNVSRAKETVVPSICILSMDTVTKD